MCVFVCSRERQKERERDCGGSKEEKMQEKRKKIKRKMACILLMKTVVRISARYPFAWLHDWHIDMSDELNVYVFG